MLINNSTGNYNAEFDYPRLFDINSNQDALESTLVKESITDVHTNASLVQTYIASCLTQKDIQLDKIKSIKKTQQETREHARYWLDTLAPKIASLYTDVTGFCSVSDSFWIDLITAAEQIKNKNDDNLETFQVIIQELKEDIKERTTNTEQLTKDLASFRGDLEKDNRNFQDIIADAQRIYSGSGGEIEIINQNITGLKSAIDTDIGIIAGGSIAVVGGIVMIGVGAIGSVFTGGAAVKLIVAGVITTVGGVAAIAVAAKDLVEKQKSYGIALQNLARLEGEMAALKNVEDHFTGLEGKNEKANKAVESMRQGWIILHNNFNELEHSATKIDTDKRVLLVNRLKATQKNFDNLNVQAQNMQKNSILKVEVSSEVVTTLGLAKTFYSFPVYSLCTKRLVKKTPWLLTLPEFAELIR
ncbi:MAG: HBL/NHE enterotoxin family protein [Candidatus Aquirickettsiella sp.]